MKDLRSRLAESPAAARRPLPFRAVYQAHPFLAAALPVAVGALLWVVGAYLRIGLLTVAGAGIVAFGIVLEALNLAEWTWRKSQRSRK